MSDNTLRAKAAIDALNLYQIRTARPEESDLKTLLADLLTDLMHACDLENLTHGESVRFADCLRLAQFNYRSETTERPKG